MSLWLYVIFIKEDLTSVILHWLLYFIFFPHLPWSHLSFSALPPEQKSPLSTPQLPPSLPPAFAQPVGYFHARPIEFKGSLVPISVRGWDQTTRSCCHTHLKASMCKWTLNNGTHSVEELRSSRETDKHSLRGKWRKGQDGLDRILKAWAC